MWIPNRGSKLTEYGRLVESVERNNIPVIEVYRMLQYLGMNGTFYINYDRGKLDSDWWAVSYVAFKRRLKSIREEFHKEYWEKYREYNNKENRRDRIKWFKEKLKGYKKVSLYQKGYLEYTLIIE